MKPIIKSFARAALAFGLVAGPLAVAGSALVLPGVAQAQTAPTIESMKTTLRDYGTFITHAKYGDVWKPTVTPRGWHPYPACDWVYTKDYGWYFQDKTVWGAIVHHYGRWIHDANDGWLWVPGAEFSPGWVVWRTSAEWVGWAPTPPDAELTPAAMEAFDDDKLWTFMDAKKFGSTCDGRTTVAFGDAWKSTTYVTDIRFFGGIGVFVLPISGPIVNVDIDVFAPWTVNFIGSWVWNWNTVFNDVDINIVVNNCGPNDPKNPNDPGRPPLTHIRGDNPPPPPTGTDRDRQPRRLRDPGQGQIKDRLPPRQIREFEPEPDDVIIDRGPGRQRQPNRDPGLRKPHRDFVDVDQGRQPRGDRGDQGRQPQADRGDQGRQPRGERGGREVDPNFLPRREASRDRQPNRESFGSRQRNPQIENLRSANGQDGGRGKSEFRGRTFERAQD